MRKSKLHTKTVSTLTLFFFSVNHIHHSITLKLVTRRKNVKMLFVGFYCHSPQLAALAISYVCHTFFISHTGHRKFAWILLYAEWAEYMHVHVFNIPLNALNMTFKYIKFCIGNALRFRLFSRLLFFPYNLLNYNQHLVITNINWCLF